VSLFIEKTHKKCAELKKGGEDNEKIYGINFIGDFHNFARFVRRYGKEKG
jgi:hypothetical protein